MSTTEMEEMMCCASCGIAEVDNIKLKNCTACKLVRYCSVTCQKEHRLKHKKLCKKRAAELRDELLFKQPENCCNGDCPICFIPIPIDLKKSILMPCCSKTICNGCDYANQLRDLERFVRPTCAFCRTPVPRNQAEVDKHYLKRVEANDPVAIGQVGLRRAAEGDYVTAFEFLTKAAELGDMGAHCALGCLFHTGDTEICKDGEERAVHHWEEAAIAGHPMARYKLGCYEERTKGRCDRAVKHFIIAANMGDDDSLKMLRHMYTRKQISKDDFAATLRAHQAAVEATKSPQRETAEAARKK